MALTLRQRLGRWWMIGRIPQFLVPLAVRRRWFWTRQRFRLRAEREGLFREMWVAIDAESPETEHPVIEKYHALITQGPNEGLRDLEVRDLQERAAKYGIEYAWFVLNAPLAKEGSQEWFERSKETDRLRRAVSEERWRRAQRASGMVVPVLSLLVALVALLTTRCGTD